MLRAQIDAANAYELLFVPALFAQWVPKVADAAHIQPGQHVLDVACGTGILAREVISRTGSSGDVVGIDSSPGMLTIARQLAPGIEWQEGVAESLPFPDQSFDAAVSQFGLMFFRDQCKAVREMLRVLAPGGRLAVAVWDSLDNIPAYADEVALLDQTAGRPPMHCVRLSCSANGRNWPRCFRKPGWAQPKSQPITAQRSFPIFGQWSKPTLEAGCQ